MRFIVISLFLMFLLLGSATITNFSAFAQTTPRPHYTVIEKPTHKPSTLYENTPVEFSTKVTNIGTSAKLRDVFLKMTYGDAGQEHHDTCDATSGDYSQSVNLAPGESIELFWKCIIRNSGTYTLEILDKKFSYNVIQNGNSDTATKSKKSPSQEEIEKTISGDVDEKPKKQSKTKTIKDTKKITSLKKFLKKDHETSLKREKESRSKTFDRIDKIIKSRETVEKKTIDALGQ